MAENPNHVFYFEKVIISFGKYHEGSYYAAAETIDASSSEDFFEWNFESLPGMEEIQNWLEAALDYFS